MDKAYRIIKYTSDMKDEWNQFVYSAKNTLFMFDRDYMDYHSDRYTDSSFMFYEDERLTAILPANEKDGVLYSHGGLTYGGMLIDKKCKQSTVNENFKLLIDECQKDGINKIYYKPIPHIYHKQPAEEEIYALYKNGASLLGVSASTVINLREPIKMAKGRKAQAVRAKREGVEIRTVKEKSFFDKFIDMENEVLESRHNTHAVHTSDELFRLYSKFPEQIHLYGAFYKDELIAGTVIYEYEQVIHTQYMTTNEFARRVGALDLTIATVIEDYKASKMWLDFGISTERDGEYLNEGLIAQKEGFGGRTNVYTLWEMDVK